MNHQAIASPWKNYIMERLEAAVVRSRRNRRTQLLRRILTRPGR
ncbi:MAG: hypothetical protein ABW101_14375 [Candidatus Thiodiazotropha sp.]